MTITEKTVFDRMADVACKQMAELYPKMDQRERQNLLFALADTLKCGPQGAVMFLARNPEALRKILMDSEVRDRAAGLLVLSGGPEPVYCLISDPTVGLALIGPRDHWLSLTDFTNSLAQRVFTGDDD